MGEDGKDGLSKQELAATDEHETKEGRSTHGTLGIVEEAENAGVIELVWVVLDKEIACPQQARSATMLEAGTRVEQTVEPAERAEDLIRRLRSPEVQSDE